MRQILALVLCYAIFPGKALAREIVVASKSFTEGYILGEIAAQELEKQGSLVNRRFGLGGTGILYQALANNEIDVYAEYTGTISEELLKQRDLKMWNEIQKALESKGLIMTRPLGFNNTYAIAAQRKWAEENHVETLSELAKVSGQVQAGFSHEFLNRADGFKDLSRHYHLNFHSVSGLEHSLAYSALEQKKIEVTDVYTTDAKVKKLDLLILKDDLDYFPKYEAVYLSTLAFTKSHPKEWEALNDMAGTISAEKMAELNALVDLDKKSFAEAAATYFGEGKNTGKESSFWETLGLRTKEHLALVGASLLIALLIGLPLGVIASKVRRLAQMILAVSGVLQTIPSLALLCFLIPFFGIGTKAALVALVLYSLLPIVLNTYTGLKSIESHHLENARAIGLTTWQTLRLIELPLSSSSILAGIKTSATISIGTATLAALIGAGGYGVPIMTGLALNDTRTILTGAVPAALMALLVQGFFELVARWIIPSYLRQS